jgi:hypothetical protein
MHSWSQDDCKGDKAELGKTFEKTQKFVMHMVHALLVSDV